MLSVILKKKNQFEFP